MLERFCQLFARLNIIQHETQHWSGVRENYLYLQWIGATLGSEGYRRIDLGVALINYEYDPLRAALNQYLKSAMDWTDYVLPLSRYTRCITNNSSLIDPVQSISL